MLKRAINLFLRSRNLLNNAFSIFNLVMGYYYMSDVEAIPQTVQPHRHRSRRSKPKIENKLVKKSNGLGLGFFLSIGSIVGLVVLGIFMMNEIWSIKKSNKGIVQIKTNLMAIQQKVISQEQNFAKLIQTLTSKSRQQEVVNKKEEEVKEEVEEEDSEEEDEDEED